MYIRIEDHFPSLRLSKLGQRAPVGLRALGAGTAAPHQHRRDSSAIRQSQEEDPGTAATNLGRMTPMGSLMGHAIYGLVLVLLYQTWPLA